MLSGIDRSLIAKAVEEAEAKTSGEIIVALANEVSRYREVPIAWAAAVALGLLPIALAIGARPFAVTIAGGWVAVQAGAVEGELARGLWVLAVIQILLFAAVAILVSLPPVRRLLTPRALKQHRVEHAAHHQFAAVSAHASESETGVLVFVSLIDRQVQILADAAIHQRCGEDPWREAAAAITSAMKGGEDPTAGIVRAVEICGAALAEHFPATGGQRTRSSTAPIDA